MQKPAIRHRVKDIAGRKVFSAWRTRRKSYRQYLNRARRAAGVERRCTRKRGDLQ